MPALISQSSAHEARIHIFWGLQRVGNHIRTLASTREELPRVGERLVFTSCLRFLPTRSAPGSGMGFRLPGWRVQALLLFWAFPHVHIFVPSHSPLLFISVSINLAQSTTTQWQLHPPSPLCLHDVSHTNQALVLTPGLWEGLSSSPGHSGTRCILCSLLCSLPSPYNPSVDLLTQAAFCFPERT